MVGVLAVLAVRAVTTGIRPVATPSRQARSFRSRPYNSHEIMTIPNSGAISPPRPGRGIPVGDRGRWIALAVVCLAMLMNALDGSIVNVALPDIQRSLHFTQSGLTWVVDAYLITFGSFLLMAGRLGDLIGRKKVFLVGVALFTLASIACGSAGGQTMLVAARFVQGIGGALSSSVIIAIIVTEFPRADERAKAMSAYIFVAVGGGSIGLLAGGVLTQALSWHWIFFVNVPIGIATLVLGRLLIVENIGIGPGDRIAHGGDLRHRHGVARRVGGFRDSDPPGRCRRALHRLRRLGVQAGQPHHAAAHLQVAQPDRFECHPRLHRHRHVLNLLHRRPLPRARARLQLARHGPRVPAVDADCLGSPPGWSIASVRVQ